MIKFFRHIRQTLIMENKTSKYFKYAIGEIVLVVIGILIALQVNNWNIERIERKSELKFLKNIQLDLEKDLSSLSFLINFRKERIKGDSKIIQHINGAPIKDITEVTKNVVNTIMEQRFSPNNNTYVELSSSGNLNLISNDSIKSLLLELEALYKLNNFGIDHEAFDYREYISKSLAKHTNLEQLTPVFMDEKTIEEQGITRESFKALFESPEYKNGIYIIGLTSKDMITLYEDIAAKSRQIIAMIQKELKENTP